MKRATKDILYSEISKDNPPTLHVEPGEEFEVETQTAGSLPDDFPEGEKLQLIGGNLTSGCIYVEGAKPDDMLTVYVGEIQLAEIGYTYFGGSNGAMPVEFGANEIGAHGKIVKIKDNKIIWNDQLELEASPMLGYVGVAPASETYHNGWAGYWGGNFDAQEITTGAKVHLPIQVQGALLHVGDMHAIQGDGEICGAGGIETEGVVKLRCKLSPKPRSMWMPRIENDTHLIAVAMARPAEDAFRSALQALILWIEEDYGLPRGEIYLLLGQVLEARCTQFVDPTFTYVAKVAKKYLKG